MSEQLLPDLAHLRHLDIVLSVEDGKLYADAPGDIPDELEALIKANKADLIARIQEFTSRPCARCQGYDFTFADDGRLRCTCYWTEPTPAPIAQIAPPVVVTWDNVRKRKSA